MIKFQNIEKEYYSKTVIRNFSLEIEEGQLVVFIGPSGCGKTTLLKMINKLSEPTSGKIFVNGTDISALDTIELRQNIGYVIQNTGLFPHMSIKENLELIPKLKGEAPESVLPSHTSAFVRVVAFASPPQSQKIIHIKHGYFYYKHFHCLYARRKILNFPLRSLYMFIGLACNLKTSSLDSRDTHLHSD